MNRTVWVAFALFSIVGRSAPEDRLQFVTTAHQLGPVNFRDPLGVVSHSGEWLAYSIATHLYLQRVSGGIVRELPESAAIIRHLAWLPDNASIAVDSGVPASRWWLYDLSGGRRMLWEGHQTLEGIAEGTHAHVSLPLTRLEQLAWSPDGKKVAGVAHVARETQLWTLDADGTHAQAVLSDASLSFPSWSPDGSLAYLASRGNRQTISLPCGKGSTPPSAPEA